jgi:hypothetical protein
MADDSSKGETTVVTKDDNDGSESTASASSSKDDDEIEGIVDNPDGNMENSEPAFIVEDFDREEFLLSKGIDPETGEELDEDEIPDDTDSEDSDETDEVSHVEATVDKHDLSIDPELIAGSEMDLINLLAKAMNDDVKDWNPTDSITDLKDRAGDVDTEMLENEGLIKTEWLGNHGKVLSLTDDGKRLAQVDIQTGHGRGDRNEGMAHKVMVSYIKRHLSSHRHITHVETYYSPTEGREEPMFDIVGFASQGDEEVPAIVCEAMRNIKSKPSKVMDHWEDMNKLGPAQKKWVVENKQAAHALCAVLEDNDVIDSTPWQNANWEEINEEAFGSESNWEITTIKKLQMSA